MKISNVKTCLDSFKSCKCLSAVLKRVVLGEYWDYAQSHRSPCLPDPGTCKAAMGREIEVATSGSVDASRRVGDTV